MNKFLHSFLVAGLMSLTLFSKAQSHIPAPPPLNPGYPFIRSLTVDCSDLIVNDIANGNTGSLESNLIDYVTQNFIGYVVLRDLENAAVFGDIIKEMALSQLIADLHLAVPGIQVGICAGIPSTLNPNLTVSISSFINSNCQGANFLSSYEILLKVLNKPSNSYSDKVKNSIVNFFLQAAAFANNAELMNTDNDCRYGFDALYVDYPFWNSTTSMAVMQNDFANFISILSVMQVLKCNSTCINFVDAEFLPTDLYKLQGWTAIDQITDADTLIDRIVLPAYTSNPNNIFDLRCKTMHFLSDQFSKTGSRIFIKLSAESSSFHYCNSNAIPHNNFGDYLNGLAFFSGNMHSLEKIFLNKFNDINFVCPACNCHTYADNHYSTGNINGNILAGSMWTPYTMMQGNQLYRKKSTQQLLPENNSIKIKDVSGRTIGNCNTEKEAIEIMKQFAEGIYLITEKRNGTIFTRKKVKLN